MTAFTELVGCRVPVQQAGFGGALNTALARAVSEAGGLGMLGGALAGADALAAAIGEARGSRGRPVGVNFVAPFLDLRRDGATFDAAASLATVVEVFYGEPDPALVARAHAGGARCSWQVGSVAEARRAEAAGVDLVVLQGVEAGGHVRATARLLPMLAEAVGAVAVPVVAAGGMGAPEDARAAM
ncbi:MAG TPA: nitronate monooxygenase, partial [Capillimicrobium sp.]